MSCLRKPSVMGCVVRFYPVATSMPFRSRSEAIQDGDCGVWKLEAVVEEARICQGPIVFQAPVPFTFEKSHGSGPCRFLAIN